MATTPEGTPYVQSSDLVANYPAASLALANRVDLVGVLPFATSTARGTAIPSPTDGQYSYLQDTNSTEFWNGSAWQAASALPTITQVEVLTSQSTTSGSYTDLATAGPAVTITTGTKALVVVGAQIYNTGGAQDTWMSWAVSGATTRAAADKWAVMSQNPTSASRAYLITGLTAGSNIFTAKYRTQAGTGNWLNRTITVMNMGS